MAWAVMRRELLNWGGSDTVVMRGLDPRAVITRESG